MNRQERPLALGLLCATTAGCEAQTGPATISGDGPEAKDWRTEVVVSGLSHLWSIAWLPDGSALVTERDGRLRRVRDGMLDPVPIAGLPPVLATGQGGLLDVSLHPDFAVTKDGQPSDLQQAHHPSHAAQPNRKAAKQRQDGNPSREQDQPFQNPAGPERRIDGTEMGMMLMVLAVIGREP